MKQVSLLGCGWLGMPLAKSLLEKGFIVKGSTTSLEKIPVLQSLGIEAHQVALLETEIKGNIKLFLQNSSILIIDIPPKLRGNSKENFVQKIQHLIPFIKESSITNVIFISSTSVYADTTLATFEVTESTKPNPNTESGRQLVAVEHLLQCQDHFETTIVRFGGLIGKDRHPVFFLSGRQHLENPEGPINLIHQTDCIGIIISILEKEYWNETLHAVAPFHPSRKAYYTSKAIELNLPIPEFEEGKMSVGKIVLSDKVTKALHYTFQKPNL